MSTNSVNLNTNSTQVLKKLNSPSQTASIAIGLNSPRSKEGVCVTNAAGLPLQPSVTARLETNGYNRQNNYNVNQVGEDYDSDDDVLCEDNNVNQHYACCICQCCAFKWSKKKESKYCKCYIKKKTLTIFDITSTKVKRNKSNQYQG